jgi:predicted enzyme related to lactoylglutathione lyase
MAGQMVHLEIPAGDTGKAREFWGSLFGWQWQAFEGPSEYHMTRLSETSGAAIYVPDESGKRGPRVYFDVDDINAAAAKVKELGGSADAPQAVPGMGWFTLCKDTEGNEFGLWQNDSNAPAPGQ